MDTLASPYEIEPYAYYINKMPKKELKELGINPDEIPYMSDEELEEASEIIGKRASTYKVKIHTTQGVCSYRLSRAISRAFDKASENCLNCELTNSLLDKMYNEIKNSETCS